MRRRSCKPGWFPADFPGDAAQASAFFDQAVVGLKRVCALTMPQVQWYEESEAGFEIMGCDFMVDQAGRVYLLEINFKPSYQHPGGTQERIERLSTLVLESVLEFAVNTPAVNAPSERLIPLYDSRALNA